MRGGFKQYRQPSVFGSEKKLKKRELPKATPILPNFKLVSIFLVIVFVLWIILFSKYFQIKDVIVEGNNLVQKETIENYAPKGKNIFLFNVSDAKKDLLREHTEIKDVIIFKGIPNAIKIQILEEDPKLVWQSGDKRYLVSTDGRVAKEIGTEEFTNLPLIVDKKNVAIELGQKVISSDFIAFVMNINNQFFDKTNIKIKNFEIEETTFDLNVVTEAGFIVKFNSIRSSARQLENLKIVLVEKRPDIHEYVDLRIDGWGYYK